eukprot:m.415649 g.415649  ORF g.415649 m.415649 type:complete len:189 (-) comp16824_c1_seq12:44-610(-)
MRVHLGAELLVQCVQYLPMPQFLLACIVWSCDWQTPLAARPRSVTCVSRLYLQLRAHPQSLSLRRLQVCSASEESGTRPSRRFPCARGACQIRLRNGVITCQLKTTVGAFGMAPGCDSRKSVTSNTFPSTATRTRSSAEAKSSSVNTFPAGIDILSHSHAHCDGVCASVNSWNFREEPKRSYQRNLSC